MVAEQACGNCWNTDESMLLYEVSLDGAITFWIAAEKEIEVLYLLMNDESFLCTIEESIGMGYTIDVQPCTEVRAKDLVFDGEDYQSTMWEEFNKQTVPGVVACSEY